MNISVIGTGAYSMAIALELAKKKNKITMWTENPKIQRHDFFQNQNTKYTIQTRKIMECYYLYRKFNTS